MVHIKVFSTATCPYCNMEKSYLLSKGIEFEDVAVDKEPEGITQLVDTCGSMAVPCTHIIHDDGREDRILGFNKTSLDNALGIA